MNFFVAFFLIGLSHLGISASTFGLGKTFGIILFRNASTAKKIKNSRGTIPHLAPQT